MNTITKRNQDGNTIVHVLLAVVVLAVIGFAGWRVVKHHKAVPVATTGTSSTTASTSSTPSTTLSSGTDNTSLTSDLSNINGSLNQSSQDSSSANTAINDQQNEITIPTN